MVFGSSIPRVFNSVGRSVSTWSPRLVWSLPNEFIVGFVPRLLTLPMLLMDMLRNDVEGEVDQ